MDGSVQARDVRKTKNPVQISVTKKVNDLEFRITKIFHTIHDPKKKKSSCLHLVTLGLTHTDLGRKLHMDLEKGLERKQSSTGAWIHFYHESQSALPWPATCRSCGGR
jgi:hypothetical protein